MIGRFILLLVLMELTGSVPGEPTRSKAAANQVSNGRIMEYTVSRVFPSNVGPLAMIRPEKIFQDHGGRYWVSGSGESEVVMYDSKLDRWTMFGDAGVLPTTLHYVFSGGPSLGFAASTIREGSDGKLWFAPNGYLNRYDHSVAWYDRKMWGKRAIAPEDGNEHVIGMFI